MSETWAGRPILRITAAGGGATLQDRGRHGALRYGITPAGPMDPLAHTTANRALGNPPGATAIEVGLGGLAVAVEGAPLDIALAGGAFRIACEGRPLPPAVALTLRPGAALTASIRRGGLILAVLVLPLMVPTLIFGVSATEAATGGTVPFCTPLAILAALSLIAAVVGTLAAAAALRWSE